MDASLDRRRFLALSGLTGLAASAGVPAVAQPARSSSRPFAESRSELRAKSRFKKAIGIGMIGLEGSLGDKFLLARDCGFDGIEMDAPSEHTLEQVLAAREGAKLAIPSVVDSVHWSHTLGDPDAEVRAQGRSGLEAALRSAAAFGATSVLLVPCVVNKQIAYADAWTRSQGEIRRVLPLAEELKVKIAVENVWNQFIMSPLEAERYLVELGSPWVGWHLDLGNLITYGWPEHWVRALGPRILQLHIKEFSRKKRDEQGLWRGFDVELGEGDNDWPAILSALAEVGYHGFAIAEVGGGGRERLLDVAARMDRILASE